MPRVRRADDIDPDAFDNGISDEIFEKIVAILRVAVPYTGIIISTRESQKTREKVLQLGVSQISGGSRTSVGGYADGGEEEDSAQFEVSDTRHPGSGGGLAAGQRAHSQLLHRLLS